MRRHPLDPLALAGGLLLGAIGLLALLDPDRTRGLDLALLGAGAIAALGLAILVSGLRRRGAPGR
jgi:hypothetical protein